MEMLEMRVLFAALFVVLGIAGLAQLMPPIFRPVGSATISQAMASAVIAPSHW